MSLSGKVKSLGTIVELTILATAPDWLYGAIHSIVVSIFEALVFVLDEIIQPVFSANRHTNQIIVFI